MVCQLQNHLSVFVYVPSKDGDNRRGVANPDFEQWWDDENAELFCWSYDRCYLLESLGTLCTQATDGG